MSRVVQDGVTFVELREEHLDDVMAIELEAYPEPWTAGLFRDEIRNGCSFFYVLLKDSEVVGYGGFWLVLDEAHITSVTVRDGYRGRGLGKRLVAFLLRLAGELGARTATLEVRASNIRAQGLYLGLGFSVVGVRAGYYPKSGEDAIVMLKELGGSRGEGEPQDGERSFPCEEM